MHPGHQRKVVWGSMVQAHGDSFDLLENFRNDMAEPLRGSNLATKASHKWRELWWTVQGVLRTVFRIPQILSHARRGPIVVCNGGIESLLVMVIARPICKKLIVDFVDFTPLHEQPRSLSTRIRRWSEERTMKIAHHAVFVSEEDRLSAIDHNLVQEGRATNIPYGITDAATIVAERHSRHLRYRDEEGEAFRIGWSGSLFVHEGSEANELQSLLDGLAMLDKEACPVRLRLIGPSYANFESAGLYGRTVEVECTGPFRWGSVDHWRLLGECDLLALPAGAYLRNANRAKVFDYMATGVPVVATETREMRRVLGPAAIYVSGSTMSWADAIWNFVATLNTSRAMGRELQDRLKHHFVASRLAELLPECGSDHS